MSKQTKSFIFLLAIAAVLTGALFLITKTKTERQPEVSQNNNQAEAVKEDAAGQTQSAQTEPPPTNIATWQQYTNSELKLSFKYPKDWKVTTAKATDPDLDIIVINPGDSQDNLRIYAGVDNYFAADGLEKEDTKIAELPGWTVEDMLFGVKSKTHYFTFDLGGNLRLQPTLKAMMSTVAFQN